MHLQLTFVRPRPHTLIVFEGRGQTGHDSLDSVSLLAMLRYAVECHWRNVLIAVCVCVCVCVIV